MPVRSSPRTLSLCYLGAWCLSLAPSDPGNSHARNLWMEIAFQTGLVRIPGSAAWQTEFESVLAVCIPLLRALPPGAS